MYNVRVYLGTLSMIYIQNTTRFVSNDSKYMKNSVPESLEKTRAHIPKPR